MQGKKLKPVYTRWWFWSVLSFPICIVLSLFGLSVDVSSTLFIISVPSIPLGFFLFSLYKRAKGAADSDPSPTHSVASAHSDCAPVAKHSPADSNVVSNPDVPSRRTAAVKRDKIPASSAKTADKVLASANRLIPSRTDPEIVHFERFPHLLNGQNLVYQYGGVSAIPNAETRRLASEIASSESWELEFLQKDDQIFLLKDGVTLGQLAERVEMVSDWLQRQELVRVFLNRLDSASNLQVQLAFYRDEKKRLSHRETTICKLTHCGGEDRQMEISCLEVGELLSFEEDFDSNDLVWIVASDYIGALPKRIASRYLDEGAAAVFVEALETNEETYKITPHVKIYW